MIKVGEWYIRSCKTGYRSIKQNDKILILEIIEEDWDSPPDVKILTADSKIERIVFVKTNWEKYVLTETINNDIV